MWISLPVAVWTLHIWSAEHDAGPAAPQRISLACQIGGAPKDYCQRVRRQIIGGHKGSIRGLTPKSWISDAPFEGSRYFCEVARHWWRRIQPFGFLLYSRDLQPVELVVDILGWCQISHGGFKRLVVHPVLQARQSPRSIRVAQVRAPSNLFCRGDLWGWQRASSAR